jgi:hypothetical protein
MPHNLCKKHYLSQLKGHRGRLGRDEECSQSQICGEASARFGVLDVLAILVLLPSSSQVHILLLLRRCSSSAQLLEFANYGPNTRPCQVNNEGRSGFIKTWTEPTIKGNQPCHFFSIPWSAQSFSDGFNSPA